VPGDRQRAGRRQFAGADGPRLGDFDQDLGVTFRIEEVDRAEMTVTLSVVRLQGRGSDGKPPRNLTVGRDRALAPDLLEPPVYRHRTPEVPDRKLGSRG
jgi:hypothetical protein